MARKQNRQSPVTDQIRRLYLNGMPNHAIAKAVKSDITYVNQVVSKVQQDIARTEAKDFPSYVSARFFQIIDNHEQTSAILARIMLRTEQQLDIAGSMLASIAEVADAERAASPDGMLSDSTAQRLEGASKAWARVTQQATGAVRAVNENNKAIGDALKTLGVFVADIRDNKESHTPSSTDEDNSVSGNIQRQLEESRKRLDKGSGSASERRT